MPRLPDERRHQRSRISAIAIREQIATGRQTK
jgi:hypothetical protein